MSQFSGLLTGGEESYTGLAGVPNALLARAENAALQGIFDAFDQLSLGQKIAIGVGAGLFAVFVLPKLVRR